jgi:hypothetical protein
MAPDQREINGGKCQKTIPGASAFLKQEKLKRSVRFPSSIYLIAYGLAHQYCFEVEN